METVVIRRRVLDDLVGGWFDGGLEMVEEMDLFCRIAHRWKLAMVPRVLANWRVHASSWTWAREELLFEEKRRLLEKFSRLIPDFDTRFAKEILAVRKEISLREAVCLWKCGRGEAAREKLRRCTAKDAKHAVLYCLSYLPARLCLPIMYRLHRRVTPA